MKYDFPEEAIFIQPVDIAKRYDNQVDPNLFKRWQHNGLVRKLKNGLYLNQNFEVRSEVDQYAIANRLYEPSYVSLHSALNYYSLIPEYVTEVISVSTKKTKDFTVDGTRFRYRKIKPDYHFGMETVEWRGTSYTIAQPEKALLDLAYLEPLFSDANWLEEMGFDRFGLKEDLDWSRMFLYAHRMKSKTVFERIGLLLNVYDVEKP